MPELARGFGIVEAQPDPLRFFFAIHTYYATFIKLLAVQIAHYFMMPKIGTGLHQIANESSDKLRDYLNKMERGGIFKDYFGINNFLEGDFFGWYLDIWDETLDGATRRIVGDLAQYSLVTLDVDPEETRDLLKKLYQNLMPRTLRHALGEYYTPDWLAERVLNQLGYDGNPSKRLLDPACGSGTFLVLALRRVRQYAEDKMLPHGEVLEQVLNNVVGFDLNPLAVISARTNFLLALGDLLQSRKGEISIPVYLADSILTPSLSAVSVGVERQITFATDGTTPTFAGPMFSFNTVVGRFSIPQELIDARSIDSLSELLEECVRSRLTNEQFSARLMGTFPSLTTANNYEREAVLKLYEQLLNLETQGINGIWARIIKNAFAPLFVGQFDYVAGNPPWVNWESLPEDYRQETIPLWSQYNLFQHTGYKAILGGSKDDISVLLTYVATDTYLKDAGKLGFIITQSVFQTAEAGRGFRRFKLGNGTPLRVIHVDDMVELQPFEGATNRTAVVIIQKSSSTSYPVNYSYWRKAANRSAIDQDATLAEIQAVTKVLNWKAEPVNKEDETSAWIVGPLKLIKVLRKVMGDSSYKARKGVFASVNGVFWVNRRIERPDGLVVIANLSGRSKRDIKGIEAAVEGDLLYPLLRGRDVQRWQYETSTQIILTHRLDEGLKAIPEDEMSVRYPRLYEYLKGFEKTLRTSGLFKRYFQPADPFYSMFNIGNYTFAPYKVVFREIAAEFTACVIAMQDNKPVIPDHKLVLCPFDDVLEAHFVCSVINSSPVRLVAQSYTIESQFSTHLFDNVEVPTFQSKNKVHRALAALSRQAHAAVTAGESVEEIEAEIDQLAAQLWDLKPAELIEIQRSLREQA